MTAGERVLIVNADDFGQSPGVNRGVMQAIESGIVTSASVMVRGSAAGHAVAYAARHPALSLGLHLDLGEWRCRDGHWEPLYTVTPLDDEAAVSAEVDRQLATFRAMTGRLPTHLDSHQHVHQREPTRSVMIAVAGTLGVPLRGCHPTIRYCGAFYGQTAEGEVLPRFISVDGLLETLALIPDGITELGCHPGRDSDLETMYRDEREVEVQTLCDPRVRAAITTLGIRLASFAGLGVHRA